MGDNLAGDREAVAQAGDQVRVAGPAFPRYFNIGGHWVNSYKVFLCIGIYSGILLSAAVAERSGISPLRLGAGCLLVAILGLIGARVYHLAVFFRRYSRDRFWAEAWNPKRGGLSVFGILIAVPFSWLVASLLGIRPAVFWDHMSIGVVFGGAWIRFGCVCNGCCGGKESHGWFARRQHDTQGIYKRRIPVQWLEIGWWLLAGLGLIWLWPARFPPGSYALGVLTWYGLGRFWLEPLREAPDLVYGRVRVDQVVAALLAIVAGGALLHLMTGTLNE
ncbi:MAG: prolipoprotein diacylglyceryl transferase family protein [Chromatiales bacterium]